MKKTAMRKIALFAALLFAVSSPIAALAADAPSPYAGKCAGCHGKAGEGSRMAPKLAEGSSAALKGVITTGTTASGKKHPKFAFTEAEISAILAQLKSK